MSVTSYIQSRKLVLVSGAYCDGCVSPTSGCALYTLSYSTVQSIAVQQLYFKPRISGIKCKSSGDKAGITRLKILYCKIKIIFFFVFVFCVLFV